MKKLSLLAILALAAIFVLPSCRHSNNSIRVSVKNNDNIYQFSASYNDRKTGRIEKLINEKISPNRLEWSEDDDVDVTTILEDKTKFHLSLSPGEIQIKVDKTENSHDSYIRVKEMCDEIKDIITSK